MAIDPLTATYFGLLATQTGFTLNDAFGGPSNELDEIVIRKWIQRGHLDALAKTFGGSDPQYHRHYVEMCESGIKYAALDAFSTRLCTDRYNDGLKKACRILDSALYWAARPYKNPSRVALTNLKIELILEPDFSTFCERLPDTFRLDTYHVLDKYDGGTNPVSHLDRALTLFLKASKHIFPDDIYQDFEKIWRNNFNLLLKCHRDLHTTIKNQYHLLLDIRSATDANSENLLDKFTKLLEDNKNRYRELKRELEGHLMYVTGLSSYTRPELYRTPKLLAKYDEILKNAPLVIKNEFPTSPERDKVLRSIEKESKGISKGNWLLPNLLKLTALSSFVNYIHRYRKDELIGNIEQHAAIAQMDVGEEFTFRCSELFAKLKPRGYKKALICCLKRLFDKTKLPKRLDHEGVMEFKFSPMIIAQKALAKNLEIQMNDAVKKAKTVPHDDLRDRLQKRIFNVSTMLKEKANTGESNGNLSNGNLNEAATMERLLDRFKGTLQTIGNLDASGEDAQLIASIIELQEDAVTKKISLSQFNDRMALLQDQVTQVITEYMAKKGSSESVSEDIS